MCSLITTLSLVFTLAVPAASDRKATPAAARVAITGKPTMTVQVRDIHFELKPGQNVEEELAKALQEVTLTILKRDESTAVAVALPTKGLDFTKLALATIRKDRLIAVEGILTTTDDKSVLELLGMKGTKLVPLLIAKTPTWVNEQNKNRFPRENQAVIQGVAKKKEIRIGSETSDWAIENADGFIPLRLAKDTKPLDAGATLLVSGALLAIDGRPVIRASKIDPARK